MNAPLKKNDLVWDTLAKAVCDRIVALTGNVLGERQIPMVHARLRRRLSELQLSPQEYMTYWKSHSLLEDEELVGLLTTHFTSFFREFLHFEWLAGELPALVERARQQGRSELSIWSAACSRGQEVWSLAMWLHRHMTLLAPNFKWSIYGSDIDKASVAAAMNGVYHHRELDTVPRQLADGFWQRGSGDIAEWMKVKKQLRDHCSFGVDNLLSLKVPTHKKFDVIFCRNVLIYFNQDDQKKAAMQLLDRLAPGGALITGVSESLSSLELGLSSSAPSVYRREAPQLTPDLRALTPVPSIPKPLKVLCVDDSATVLKILKKLLTHSDFEVVGTATNGQEAMESLKTLRPDVITLDLHMPVMDGFSLVKQTDTAQRWPVLVLSTVERDNANLVQPLFDAGVCDFLEKPTFENLGKIGEELQQKLKMAWWAKHRPTKTQATMVAPSTARKVLGRVIMNAGLADRNAVHEVLSKGSFVMDEVRLLINAEQHLWKDWALELKSEFMSLNLQVDSTPTWVRDSRPTVFLQFAGGQPSYLPHAQAQGAIIVLEETQWPPEIMAIGADVFPVTSFPYMCNKFLEGK